MSRNAKSVLTDDVAGLDISDRNVSVARVKARSNGGFNIQNAGWMSLPENASEAEIAAVIKKLWRKCRINTYSVCSCFRSRKLTIKRFSFPDISQDDLGSTLSLEVESLLQISSEEFFLDWQLDTPGEHQDGTPLSGTFIVAPREEVERHLRILKAAALTPSALDVAPASLSNLYLQLFAQPGEHETICMIHTTEHTADIVFITHDRKMHAHTVLSLNESWQNNVDYLYQNLCDILQFSRTKLGLNPTSRILLTGEPSTSAQLIDRMEQSSSVPASYWNPSQESNVRAAGPGVLKNVKESGTAMLATSIGTALRRYIQHGTV